MDGVQQIDRDDDMPIDLRSIFQPVSLSRDRCSRPESSAKASFTIKQLDAVAPLSHSDLMSLRLNTPSAHTKDKVQRRIEAAYNLKYGCSHAE